MLKLILPLAFGSLLMGSSALHAHSHHHHDVYIVESNPTPVVVIQQPVQPVVVVQPTQGPAVYTSAEAPPADLIEQIPVSPGETYVWQKGHWHWDGSWQWTSGQWAERPHGHTVYVPGYWKLSTHHHRWEWVQPYWK